MNSKTILLFFGVLVCVAISTAMAENENEEGLAENSPVERIVRMADRPKRERNGRRGKKPAQKKAKASKKGRKVKATQRGIKARKNNGKRKSRKNKERNEKVRNKQKQSRNRQKQSRSRQKQSRQDTSSMVDSTCLSNAVLYMKQLKDVVGNFEKQNKRMKAQNKTGGNKAGKKGAFASIALNLVDIGGGNKSSLSCAGSTTNSGAKQLANLTSELFDCEKNVNASCSTDNFPQPNMTLISNCETLTADFKKNVTECLDKTVGGKATTSADACTCWSSKDLATASTDIKECKATDAAKAITTQLNVCKAAFGKCRKYEDAAGASLTACSQSTSGLTSKAATLKANSDALTSAKTKMSSLASSSSGRRARATATTCAEVISKAATLSSTASSSPSDSSIATLAAEISGVSSSVSCTDTEKTSMTTQVSALETAITAVDDAYSAVQSLLETLTGSTASSASLTTASSATAASSGRRERLVRDIMKNLL